MNFAFLPDLSALAILIIILSVLHRRHPQKQADVWLLGLFLTLVEAAAHDIGTGTYTVMAQASHPTK